MNFAAYCQLDAVNASSLKAAAVSPLHYHYGLSHARPDTAAMAKGRAIHCATLEPDEFPRRYTVWNGARRGKDWLSFEDAYPMHGDTYNSGGIYRKWLADLRARAKHNLCAS